MVEVFGVMRGTSPYPGAGIRQHSLGVYYVLSGLVQNHYTKSGEKNPMKNGRQQQSYVYIRRLYNRLAAKINKRTMNTHLLLFMRRGRYQYSNYTSNDIVRKRKDKEMLSRCYDNTTDRTWQLSRPALLRLVPNNAVPCFSQREGDSR